MEFHLKLPHNAREFILFMGVISIISVNIIAPLITCFEAGFRFSVWLDVLQVLPWIWLAVIALVLVTLKPAEMLARKLVAASDSFAAHMLANVLASVFLLSILLTVIGTWIGTRSLGMEPIRLFFYRWPRNFAISLAVEALVAQPVARRVMVALHTRINSRTAD
jgi:hypothetical protein